MDPSPARTPRLSAGRTALLLDFDGTLVDIAPAPDLIVVPQTLADSLRRVRAALGDALAIVTGRTLDEIDLYLPGVPFAVAAEHGAILRRGPGAAIEHVALPDVPEPWRETVSTFAQGYDGARVEQKKTGFVLHFRGCPDRGPGFRAFLDRLIEGHEGEFGILSSKMAWELRAVGADKGTAVAALMSDPPFAGRSPVFVGDDVTDQHGIDACIAMGGTGFLVPDAFGEPPDVREWLRILADGEGGWES